MLNNKYPQPQSDFKVLVRCFTFNHSKYIEDALKGFVVQQTTFPFVCLIMDDASTDGEQEVIKSFLRREFNMAEAEEYDNDVASIIQVSHITNKNCAFVVYFLKENHYSQKKSKIPYVNPWRDKCKYEALCEGDDYWIDPLKLQKQVDLFQKDCSLTMIYTSFNTVDVSGKIIYLPTYERHIKLSKSGYVLPRLMKNNHIMTLTTMFKKEVFDDLLYQNSPAKYDYTYFLSAASQGNLYFLNEKTGCYRITSTGAVATRNGIIQRMRKEITKYFSMEYLLHNIDEPPKNKTALYVSILLCYIDNKKDMKQIIRLRKNLSLYIPIAVFVKLLDSIMYRLKMKQDSYSLLFHV